MKMYISKQGLSRFNIGDAIVTFDCDKESVEDLVATFYKGVAIETITTPQATTTRAAVDEQIISELKAENAELYKRIDELKERNDSLLTTLYGYVMGIMQKLALITILQSSHSEKNAKIREIVRYLETVKRIIDCPPQDIDDIPF